MEDWKEVDKTYHPEKKHSEFHVRTPVKFLLMDY